MGKFTMQQAETILRDVWGHPQFRKAQETAMEIIAQGDDLLAIMPTSAGQSVLYQIPSLLAEGTGIVISPLIALMKDQCADATAKGISATYVNSHVSPDEVQERLEGLQCGTYKLFYLSPEMLNTARMRTALLNCTVSYMCVDEAHCVSTEGWEFRPAYSLIGETVKALAEENKRPQIIAVTATATEEIEDDIAQRLGMYAGYKKLVGDPIRPNFSYEVIHAGSAWDNLRLLMRSWDLKNGRYIVYVGTRSGAETVAATIALQLGMPETTSQMPTEVRRDQAKIIGQKYVGFYHAGMDRDDTTGHDDNGVEVEVLGRNTDAGRIQER